MEWLKGKTYLPVRRQILSEICRLSPGNSVRNASERSQNLASAALREPCLGGLLRPLQPTKFLTSIDQLPPVMPPILKVFCHHDALYLGLGFSSSNRIFVGSRTVQRDPENTWSKPKFQILELRSKGPLKFPRLGPLVGVPHDSGMWVVWSPCSWIQVGLG
jgi:hypothetical protein